MNGYLRHLVNFARVVNAGSVSSAANQEKTSPSTMSESVKMIEAFAGRGLLERSRQGVQLLPEGQAIYEEANEILNALERVRHLRQGAKMAGDVRLSIPRELAMTMLSDGINRLAERHSKISLNVYVEDTVLDHLRHTRDLYLRVSQNQTYSGLSVLGSVPMHAVLVAAPGFLKDVDPSDPMAVAALRFLTSPTSKKPLRLPMIGQEAPLEFTDTLHVDDIATRLQLARDGVGLAGCLDIAVRNDLASGRLRHVLPDGFRLPLIALVGTPQKSPPPHVAAAAACIVEALQDCAATK